MTVAPPGQRPPFLRDPLVHGAVAFALATRLALFAVVWFAQRALPVADYGYAKLPDRFLPAHPLLDGWARWDAAHYVALARFGYSDANPSADGGFGFFPLYPLAMRALVALTGAPVTDGALAVAGIVVANLCFLAAIALVARWTAAQAGDVAARTTVALLCCTPFAFFFSAAYSESLFLLLVVAALMLASGNRWVAAGVVAGLASATRLVGLGLAPALLLLAIRRRASLRDTVASAGLAGWGFLAFTGYQIWRTGSPTAYFDAQAQWGGWNEHVRVWAERIATDPRDAVGGDPRNLVILANVALLLVALACLPAAWRRLDPATALFTTLLVVGQGAMTWVSLGRYLLPAIGVTLVAGRWLATSPRGLWARDAVIVASALAMTALAILFAHGFWVV
jgi:hypothetical protein